MEIRHLRYGEGTIVDQHGKVLTVQFGEDTRKMDLLALFLGGAVEDVPEDLLAACRELRECDENLAVWRSRYEGLRRRLAEMERSERAPVPFTGNRCFRAKCCSFLSAWRYGRGAAGHRSILPRPGTC